MYSCIYVFMYLCMYVFIDLSMIYLLILHILYIYIVNCIAIQGGFPGPFNQTLPSSEPSSMQGTTSSCRRHIWAEAALGQAGGLVLEPFALPWTA